MTAYFSAIVSIVFGAIAQYLLKLGISGQQISDDGNPPSLIQIAVNTISSPAVWAGITFYGLSMVLWLFVLSKLELSKAYPMVSLGYILTLAFGYFLLGETITLLRLAGVVLIMCGVILISMS